LSQGFKDLPRVIRTRIDPNVEVLSEPRLVVRPYGVASHDEVT